MGARRTFASVIRGRGCCGWDSRGPLLFAFAFVIGIAAGAEMTVKLSDVPAKAQKAIQAHVGEGKLGTITRTSEGCETRFDVEMTKGGRDRSFAVDEEGELIEVEVFMRDVPQPVQRAIHARIGRGPPESITKANDDGEISYDVEFTKDGKERDFTLDSKGEVLQERMFLDELPESVRNAIQKQAAGSKSGEIYKTTDEGEAYFEVEFERNGKSRTVGFNPKGTIAYQDESVSFSEVPEAARNAAKAKLGESSPCDVNKHTEEDGVSYDIEFKKDGKVQSVTVSAEGK